MCYPHWSPVRDLVSPRDLWRRDTKLRVLVGGAPRSGGRSLRPSGDVCAEPLGSQETRGVPSSGAGPSQNGTCSGGGIGRNIRAGRSTVNYFPRGRTRVCITPISLHPPKIIGSSGKKRLQAIEQAVESCIY